MEGGAASKPEWRRRGRQTRKAGNLRKATKEGAAFSLCPPIPFTNTNSSGIGSFPMRSPGSHAAQNLGDRRGVHGSRVCPTRLGPGFGVGAGVQGQQLGVGGSMVAAVTTVAASRGKASTATLKAFFNIVSGLQFT